MFVVLDVSLESNLTFLTNVTMTKGKIIITEIEIAIQIFLQSIKVNKKIINNGKINSANDKPSQVVLNARPLVLSKNLEIVVVAVWDISPWPDNLIKKIDKNKKATEEILENKKLEIASKAITQNANSRILKSSIFFPTQTSIKLYTCLGWKKNWWL